ncbi:SDR family NAD(P)-dependent oxidoreductase [uncultured Amnibacterium sp.]|uniref:SDR family NAD(P)-dependent oxidoreductase n=1 Tax=uncultured Amnibacterium sp. TaxID=1631851 RepID=UPI0035CBE124
MAQSRVAIITGASQGIGEAAAHVFAEDGVRLVLSDLTDAVHAVGTEIAAAFPSSQTVSVVTDLSDPAACDALVARAVEQHGSLDIVIHATAVMQQVGPVQTTDPDDWDRVLAMNARGPFLLSRSALRVLPRPGGRIVFTGSATGQIGQAYLAAYSASKGALRAFTHSLALEVAAEGITVNGVAPAHVEAAINQSALERAAAETGRSVEDLRAERDSGIPVRRQATAREIAQGMHYLASPEAAYVTGTWLDINGGALLR